MNKNQLVKTSDKLTFSSVQNEPKQVLEFAHKAAQALMDIVNKQSKKIMINGERYLDFQSWQTLARFYGITTGIEWCRQTHNEKKVFGFEARALVYQNGVIISAAEASCFRDEVNWKDKPSFQIKSMAQTRASSKALRNVLAWVAVLGGFKPTPAEEMEGVFDNQSSDYSEDESSDYESIEEDINSDYEQKDNSITDKQARFLKELIKEKILDEEERENHLANLSSLTKWEASEFISELKEQTEPVFSC